MGFGEEYQGMTPEMVMVEIATRLKSIEGKVDKIQCPSPKCANHEQRIAEQERVKKELDEKAVSKREIVLWAIGIVAMTIASNFALILSFKGG
jgi:uncharacterized membrane protein YvbJ